MGHAGFIDVGAVTGSDLGEDGRGLGVADIDNDGDLDFVIQNYRRPAAILVNHGDKGNALQIRLHGVESNRSAIGTQLSIRHDGRTQTRQVVCGAGYLSSQTQLVHFGVGEAESVDELRVRWPSGRVQVFEDIQVNRRFHITEGQPRLGESRLVRQSPASRAGGDRTVVDTGDALFSVRALSTP